MARSHHSGGRSCASPKEKCVYHQSAQTGRTISSEAPSTPLSCCRLPRDRCDVDAELRDQVNHRVAKLIPPKNITEAKAIALTGDLAVPFLAYNEQFSVEEAVACVQSLKLIGTNAALSILRSYRDESRQTVVREIAKDTLDDAVFRREVLTELKHLFAFTPVQDFITTKTLEQLRDFPQLRHTSVLDLSDCRLLKDLKGLPTQMPELTTLNLSGCISLKDLNDLPVLPKLTKLMLNDCTSLEFGGLCTLLLQNTSVKEMPLRHKPEASFTESSVRSMLEKTGLFDYTKNMNGRGISHFFVGHGSQQQAVVIDFATGLTWQQSGSKENMRFKDAKEYIKALNHEKFAGYNDWCLPTLEEAMSLMEPEKKNGDLYIDPVFDRKQFLIWTADKQSAGVAWGVSFLIGSCAINLVDYIYYNSVRAVRSGQS